MALTWALALAPVLGLGLAQAADAATSVTVSLASPTVTIAMDAAVTTLTLSRDPSGARRIHEDGRALTFSSDPANPGGCDVDTAVPGDIVCTDPGPLVWNVSNAASPGRDVLIAKSAMHGDTTGFFDETLHVLTSTLMEAWLPDGPTANTATFTGSETVAPPGQPADIVHVGSAGLSAGPAAASNVLGGDDRVTGTTGEVDVLGGNGDDTLIGSSASDTINGGAGSDLIRGGLGLDSLNAGAGFGPADVLSFDDAGRSSPLTATFASGSAPAISAGGDGDTLAGTFEVLEGTPLGDTLTAGATGAVLRGAEGDDILQGGPAADTFDGGDGADDIRSRDGLAEAVDCGAGLDQLFTVDDTDTLTGCEGPQPVDLGPPPAAGAALAPAAGAAPAPGAGAGAGGAGNAAASLPAIGATLTAAFGVRGSSTTVTTLTAKKLPKGASVTITCTAPKGKGSACAFKTKTKAFAKATASSAFGSLFKKRKLPVKTVVVVRITAPGVRGTQFTFTTRKGKQPKQVSAAT